MKKSKKNENVSISTPIHMPIIQTDILEGFSQKEKQIKVGDDWEEFNAFTLLDSNLKSTQIYSATHLCYGMYHAGVVCNDVDTNQELV